MLYAVSSLIFRSISNRTQEEIDHGLGSEDHMKLPFQSGLGVFGEACLKAGIVKTMLTVMKNNGMHANRQSATTTFYAATCQCKLLRMGNMKERQMLSKQFADNDGSKICLDVSPDHITTTH